MPIHPARFAAVLMLPLVVGSPCRAADDDALRQQAIRACSDDALRLCAGALSDEQSTIACMAGRRSQLGPSCRAVYDRIVQAVRR